MMNQLLMAYLKILIKINSKEGLKIKGLTKGIY